MTAAPRGRVVRGLWAHWPESDEIRIVQVSKDGPYERAVYDVFRNDVFIGQIQKWLHAPQRQSMLHSRQSHRLKRRFVWGVVEDSHRLREATASEAINSLITVVGRT